MHVDRAPGKGARAATVGPAETIDVGHRQRRPVLGGGRDLGGFAHLAPAVAVDLGHRDLGDAVVLEERQQVVGEVVRVAAGGVLLDLELLRREPIGRELVEGRVGVLGRRGIRPRRPPRAEVDVAEHDRELALRHRQSPAVFRLAQGHVLALAVGSKAQREAGLAWCRPDHLSSCGACHGLPDPFARLPTSMQAPFARGVCGGLADCAISRLLHGCQASEGARAGRTGVRRRPPGVELSLVGPHMQQRRPRRRATGTLASAPRRSGLGQGRGRRLADCLELLSHARG